MTREHIRTWAEDGFRLELYDTFRSDSMGKSILAYELYDGDELIFEGEDYHCSPLHSIDGDDALAGLLCFLSLRPGDTDSEYFESYTPRQREWAESGRAETLGYLQSELERQE